MTRLLSVAVLALSLTVSGAACGSGSSQESARCRDLRGAHDTKMQWMVDHHFQATTQDKLFLDKENGNPAADLGCSWAKGY